MILHISNDCFVHNVYFLRKNVNSYATNTPVAQWIEHRPPTPCALVRSQSGVPYQHDQKYHMQEKARIIGLFCCPDLGRSTLVFIDDIGLFTYV